MGRAAATGFSKGIAERAANAFIEAGAAGAADRAADGAGLTASTTLATLVLVGLGVGVLVPVTTGSGRTVEGLASFDDVGPFKTQIMAPIPATATTGTSQGRPRDGSSLSVALMLGRSSFVLRTVTGGSFALGVSSLAAAEAASRSFARTAAGRSDSTVIVGGGGASGSRSGFEVSSPAFGGTEGTEGTDGADGSDGGFERRGGFTETGSGGGLDGRTLVRGGGVSTIMTSRAESGSTSSSAL